MTRELPAKVQPVVDAIAASDAYLWSTLRIPGVTCRVCNTPTGGGDICGPCKQHGASDHPVADAVGTLIYAEYGTQSYHLVKHYKGDNPGPSLRPKMSSLLAIGLQGHQDCIMEISSSHDMGWAVVPSTRRPGPDQPLRQVVLTFANPGREVRLGVAPTILDPRALDPAHFPLAPGQVLPDSVVVVDDSWASGGHAQSVAAALKLAGVRHVAVFAVARLLDPNWRDTDMFLKSQPRGTRVFEPTRCPWTADGVCP